MPDLDAEPSFLPAHVCRDDARSDFLIEITIRPFDANRPRGSTGANEPFSDKSIQVEAKPVLQASTLTRARHSIVPLVWTQRLKASRPDVRPTAFGSIFLGQCCTTEP